MSVPKRKKKKKRKDFKQKYNVLRFASDTFLLQRTPSLSAFLTMIDLHFEKIMLITVENDLEKVRPACCNNLGERSWWLGLRWWY